MPLRRPRISSRSWQSGHRSAFSAAIIWSQSRSSSPISTHSSIFSRVHCSIFGSCSNCFRRRVKPGWKAGRRNNPPRRKRNDGAGADDEPFTIFLSRNPSPLLQFERSGLTEGFAVRSTCPSWVLQMLRTKCDHSSSFGTVRSQKLLSRSDSPSVPTRRTTLRSIALVDNVPKDMPSY